MSYPTDVPTLYGLQTQEKLACVDNPGVVSLRQNLQIRLANTEKEVLRLNELLQLLDKNPDIQRILELLGRQDYADTEATGVDEAGAAKRQRSQEPRKPQGSPLAASA